MVEKSFSFFPIKMSRGLKKISNNEREDNMKDDDFTPCPNCGHMVELGPDELVCPACGEQFEIGDRQ